MGSMQATLSLPGAAMLLFVGVAAVLAVVMLILWEARWIVRLGQRLVHTITLADQAGRKPEPEDDRR
jgi:hypothetical protein